MLLQDAMPKPPCRPVRIEEVAGGHFVGEMDEALIVPATALDGDWNG
jgi:hypothetical protein